MVDTSSALQSNSVAALSPAFAQLNVQTVNLTVAFVECETALAKFIANLGQGGNELSRLFGKFSELSKLISAAAAKFGEGGNAVSKFAEKLGGATGAISRFAEKFPQLSNFFSHLGKGHGTAHSAIAAATGATAHEHNHQSNGIFGRLEKFAGSQTKGILRTTTGSGVAGAASGLIQGFSGAIGGLTAAIGSAAKGLDTFVSALSPGLMEQFNRAIDNLNATIGVAFTGVFSTFIGVLQEAGGVLLPVMQQLQPIITLLAQTIGQVVIFQVKIFAASLAGLMPFFQMLANVLNKVVDALSPVFAFLAGWEALGSIVADLITMLETPINYLIAGFKKCNEAILLFIIGIAKAIGYTKFVDGAKSALAKNTQSGEHAAGSVSLKGLESLNKDIQKLAFSASGGGPDGGPQSDNEKLLKAIEDASPNETVTLIRQELIEIKQAILSAINHVTPPSYAEVKEKSKSIGKRALSIATFGASRLVTD